MASDQTAPQYQPLRRKLLIADDHQMVLDALAFIAAPEYEVRGADSLQAFEKAVDEFAPDLAILDIHMPDGDGLEAGRRTLERRPGLKLMFLSMHTEASFARRAMETGARAFISKRAPLEELLAAMGTVMNGGKYIGAPAAPAEPDGHASEADLTERQLEVLRLISQGCSAKEIANRLNISVRTAEFHRAAIMDRLKLHSTAMLTRYAVERGLV
jgi:two-component system nitrate/nitrite response regulator NarL